LERQVFRAADTAGIKRADELLARRAATA